MSESAEETKSGLSGKIEQMRDKLATALTPKHDDHYLLRFLTKCNMKVDEAVEMFLKMLDWRKANGIDEILWTFPLSPYFKFFMKYWPSTYLKSLDDKYTVYYENIGMVDVTSLMKIIPVSVITKFHIYTVEVQEEIKRRQIKERGEPKPLYIIQEMGQISTRHLHMAGIKLLKELNCLDDTYYPNRIEKMALIRIPLIGGFHKILRSIFQLSENSILMGDEILKDIIGKEDMPSFLGGNAQVCLNRGGTLDYDDIFPCKRQVIHAGFFHEEVFEVRKKNVINIYFATMSYDIRFSLCIFDEDDGSVENVFEPKLYDSHVNGVCMSCVCERNGRCVARFDNTYSRWNSKSLILNIKVIDMEEYQKSVEQFKGECKILWNGEACSNE